MEPERSEATALEGPGRAEGPLNPQQRDQEEIAKYQKQVKDLEEKVEWQYNALEDRDGVVVPKLKEKIETLEASNGNLRANLHNLRTESKKFETTLSDEKKRLQNEEAEHNQSKTSLRSWQQKCKQEEARANRAESRLDDSRKRLEELELECDHSKAMIMSLHQMIDRLETECEQARQELQVSTDAMQRLQDIEDTFDPIFRELGIQLTPQNLIERFTIMHNKSLSRPEGSEQNLEAQLGRRPNLNERKISVASIGDELNAFDSDEEFEEDSPLAVSHHPDVQEHPGVQHKGRSGELSGNGQISVEKTRPSSSDHSVAGERPISVGSQSSEPTHQGDDRRRPSSEEGAGPIIDIPARPGKTNSGSTEEKSPHSSIETDDVFLPTVRLSAGSLPHTIVQVPSVQQDKEAQLAAELVRKEKQIRELRQQLETPPTPRTTAKFVRTYLTIPHEATFSELFERAPWWMKAILMIMALAYAAMYVAAWRERNLWLAANDTTYIYGRHLQSTSNQCHWAIIEWFENYIGLDKGLFG